MAEPYDWPATIPWFAEHGSWQESPEPNIADFPVEVGPSKRRRRTYLPSNRLQFSRLISKEHLEEFLDFFHGTLKDGVYTFQAIDPRTGELTEYQFMQVPSWRDVATNDETTLWRLSFSLRKMNLPPAPLPS